MKTHVLAALAALATVVAIGGQAQAQSNPAGANAAKFGVAVVDINYIFKNHSGFRTAMEAMKEDFKKVEAGVVASQQKIKQAQERKQAFKPGSPQFKELDEQIVRMNATLQVDVTQQRKDLMEREAGIYYETYREVEAAIRSYAEYKKIGLVLRFNGEEADQTNRESILRSINKAVHFQNSIDITPDVLAYLNRNATAARPGAAAR